MSGFIFFASIYFFVPSIKRKKGGCAQVIFVQKKNVCLDEVNKLVILKLQLENIPVFLLSCK